MIVEELEKLLEEKKYIEFRRKIQDMPPQDIAELLEELESTQAIIAFRLLPKEKAADVFPIFHLNYKQKYLLQSTIKNSWR